MRAQPPAVKGIDIILEPTRDLRHFVVMVPGDMTIPISMSEHWRWQDSEALRDESVLCYQDRLEIRNIAPIGARGDQTIMPEGNASLALQGTQVIFQLLLQGFILVRVGTEDLNGDGRTQHGCLSFPPCVIHIMHCTLVHPKYTLG